MFRGNPLIKYYSPFSGSGRRSLRVYVFLTLYTFAVAVGVYFSHQSDKSWAEIGPLVFGFFSSLSYYFLPALIFFFLAPRLRTQEILEELSLTRMTRGEITLGYAFPPLIVYASILAINTVAMLIMLINVLVRKSFNDDSTMLFVALLSVYTIGGLIAGGVALRNWLTYPQSIIRPFLQVPVLTCLQSLMCAGMFGVSLAFASIGGVSNDKNGSILYPFLLLPIFIFSLVQSFRHSTTRFFRMVDPVAYRTAYWFASERVWPFLTTEQMAERKLFNRQWRRVAGKWSTALVTTMLCYLILLGLTYVAVHFLATPVITQNPNNYSPPQPDLYSMMINQGTPLMLSAIFSAVFVVFVARQSPARVVPVLPGGIIHSIVMMCIPSFVFSIIAALPFIYLTAFIREIAFSKFLAETALGYVVCSILVVVVVTTLTFSAPRKWALITLALCLSLVQILPIISYNLDVQGSRYRSRNLDEGLGYLAMILLGFFVLYGIDFICQRIHRLQVRAQVAEEADSQPAVTP